MHPPRINVNEMLSDLKEEVAAEEIGPVKGCVVMGRGAKHPAHELKQLKHLHTLFPRSRIKIQNVSLFNHKILAHNIWRVYISKKQN